MAVLVSGEGRDSFLLAGPNCTKGHPPDNSVARSHDCERSLGTVATPRLTDRGRSNRSSQPGHIGRLSGPLSPRRHGMAPAPPGPMIEILPALLALSASLPGSTATSEALSHPGANARIEAQFEAGDPSSAITLLLYASLEGARDGTLVSSIYREVSYGRLRGKVKLALRPLLPEAGGDEPARAVTAAAGQGMLWPYLLSLYGEQVPLERCTLRKRADKEGLDGDAFEVACRNLDTDRFLAAARAACRQHHLTDTPAAFVSGRRVPSDMTAEQLIRLLEAEHARLQAGAQG